MDSLTDKIMGGEADKMLVSVIIICRNERELNRGLLTDVSGQGVNFETETIKIINVSPPAKARNMGAQKAKGEFLVFLDGDIRLGNELFLSNLINPLIPDNTIGATCASVRIPEQACKFQQSYAKQIPHSISPIVDGLTEVYLATSQCFAIRRDLFIDFKGFNEDIIRGEDSEISLRLMKAGYRLILVPQTWCYHPLPDNIIQLIKIQLRNGRGAAFVDIFYPHLNIDIHPEGIMYFSENKSISQRINRFLAASAMAVCKMKALLVFSKFFYGLGFLYGVTKYGIMKFGLARRQD
jgi:cellulose synthase/poly-beta-1,6-N-acetylglucosamine synthase-like glycosyltransferase